jgi:hypothetical protein
MGDVNKALVQALEWYAEQARLCRLIHSEGDSGRHALQADGGKRARAALAAAQEPDLTDPSVVHVNMLRGSIAKPTWAQICHLYPVETAAPDRYREGWIACRDAAMKAVLETDTGFHDGISAEWRPYSGATVRARACENIRALTPLPPARPGGQP